MTRRTLKTGEQETHGGKRSNAGRNPLPAEKKRVKIDIRVDSGTFFMLKITGVNEGKGRAASPGAQAARVLDRWNELKGALKSVEIAEPENDQEPSKRLQVTAWVLPATARALYGFSIAKPPALRSQARNAGLVVDRWAAREDEKKRQPSEVRAS